MSERSPDKWGGAIGEPIYGFADDGFDGAIDNAIGDTYEFNFDWLVASGFGFIWTLHLREYKYQTPNGRHTRRSSKCSIDSIRGGISRFGQRRSIVYPLLCHTFFCH